MPDRSTTRTPPRICSQIVKTKKTELLFLALFLRLLKPGGRAAVIVPDGVLFGSSNAHKTLRKILVEEQKLDAVISLPGGVFKPYAGVSTAILAFHQDQLRRHGLRLVLRRGRRRHVASTTNARRCCLKKNSAPRPAPAWTPAFAGVTKMVRMSIVIPAQAGIQFSRPTNTRRTISQTSSRAGAHCIRLFQPTVRDRFQTPSPREAGRGQG